MKKYISDHWKGAHSLARSFWVNCYLITFLFYAIIVFFLVFLGYDETIHPVLAAQVDIGIFITGLIISIWQIIGTWRCTKRYIRDDTQSHFWPRLVQFILALNIIVSAASYYNNGIFDALKTGFLPNIM